MQTQIVRVSVQTMHDYKANDCEYRVFLLHISDELALEDCRKIVFLERLTLPLEYENCDEMVPLRLTLLAELERRGRVSASRLDDLAKILMTIERQDLEKKVKAFAKQQERERKVMQATNKSDQILSCTSDTIVHSPLCIYTMLTASGICHPYFLASNPGLWRWSRGRIEHS